MLLPNPLVFMFDFCVGTIKENVRGDTYWIVMGRNCIVEVLV